MSDPRRIHRRALFDVFRRSAPEATTKPKTFSLVDFYERRAKQDSPDAEKAPADATAKRPP